MAASADRAGDARVAALVRVEEIGGAGAPPVPRGRADVESRDASTTRGVDDLVDPACGSHRLRQVRHERPGRKPVHEPAEPVGELARENLDASCRWRRASTVTRFAEPGRAPAVAVADGSTTSSRVAPDRDRFTTRSGRRPRRAASSLGHPPPVEGRWRRCPATSSHPGQPTTDPGPPRPASLSTGPSARRTAPPGQRPARCRGATSVKPSGPGPRVTRCVRSSASARY